MVSRRLSWAVAQLGRKPGAAQVLARCVDVDDLPAAHRPWRRTDERTWRTGVSAAAEPWAASARDAGSITVWRSFASAPAQRTLWVQVVPLARIEDGQAALAAVSRSELRNLRAKVSVVATTEILPTPSVPGASLVSATEQQTRGDGNTGSVLTLRYVVRADMVVMSAASPDRGSAWTWPDLLTLAAAQARKLTA